MISNCSSIYLPGCGVDVVSWIALSERHPHVLPVLPGNPIDEMRRLVDELPRQGKDTPGPRIRTRRLRAWKKLLRYEIDTWEKLAALLDHDFRSWGNYGKCSHGEMQSMASMVGIDLPDL